MPNYPVTEKDLPSWVPYEKKIREDMVLIFNSAIELADIQSSPYKITKAWIDDGYIKIIIERSFISAEIKIGKFDNVKSIKVNDNTLHIEYFTKSEMREKLFWGFGGGTIGIIIGILIILIL